MTEPEWLLRAGQACEPELVRLLSDGEAPEALLAAMRHGALGGGKRLRPALLLGAAAAAGAGDAVPRLLPAACALELLHTYSLIHDDLPAMDDAALRRGKPAVHRVHGEAAAILAGDALQALAFGALAAPLPGVRPADQLAAVADLAAAAGAAGMCGGQALDLAATRDPPDDAGLSRLQAKKTGALIAAAAVIGGRLAGAGAGRLAALAAYGASLGRAFQIADDLLDVTGDAAALGKTAGSDAAAGKVTFASRFGVDAARGLAAAAVEAALAALRGWDAAADPLRDLAAYAVGRVH